MGLFKHREHGGPRIVLGIEQAPEPTPGPTPVVRTFGTGANRDVDTGKFDYEGFLSPLVLRRFGAYMHKNRYLRDGTVRDSDNWQKGIPKDVYIKSGFRHWMDFWLLHRGYEGEATQDPTEALCGLLFNTMGYLHELLMSGNPDREAMSGYADKDTSPGDILRTDSEQLSPELVRLLEEATAGPHLYAVSGAGSGRPEPSPEALAEAQEDAAATEPWDQAPEPGTEAGSFVQVTDCWCDLAPYRPHEPHLQMQDLESDELALRTYVIQQNGLTAFVGPANSNS